MWTQIIICNSKPFIHLFALEKLSMQKWGICIVSSINASIMKCLGFAHACVWQLQCVTNTAGYALKAQANQTQCTLMQCLCYNTVQLVKESLNQTIVRPETTCTCLVANVRQSVQNQLHIFMNMMQSFLSDVDSQHGNKACYFPQCNEYIYP